jgi:hypothetical protein
VTEQINGICNRYKLKEIFPKKIGILEENNITKYLLIKQQYTINTLKIKRRNFVGIIKKDNILPQKTINIIPKRKNIKANFCRYISNFWIAKIYLLVKGENL